MWLKQAAYMCQGFHHVCRRMQDTGSDDDVKILHLVSLRLRIFLYIEQSILDKRVLRKFHLCFLEEVWRNVCIDILCKCVRQRGQDRGRCSAEACPYF